MTTQEPTPQLDEILHKFLADEVISEAKAAINKLRLQDERRGEKSQLKMLEHWLKLHNPEAQSIDPQIVLDYINHVCTSLEQFPEQRTASQSLETLKTSEAKDE